MRLPRWLRLKPVTGPAAFTPPRSVLKVFDGTEWVEQVAWLSMDDAYRLDSFLSALAHGRVVRANSMTLDDLTEARALAGVVRMATKRAEGRT